MRLMTKRKDMSLVDLKARLEAQKAELLRLMAATKESRAPVELDQTVQGRLSRQDALMQQEMARENHRRRQLDLQRTEAALKRMEEGDYGYCVNCDEAIAAKRLELDPAIPTCIKCAGKSA